MSTINSLGIGSGVLTADIIDQLREADNSRIIKPLENKITLANQKEDAYELLSSLMTTFKSSASALDGDNLYLGRSVTGNTDAVTVTAEAGSNVQNFSITDATLAKADVWNSTKSVTNADAAITGLSATDGTLTINVDGQDFDIPYKATSTLNEIKDSLNEIAGTKMTASVLQVGESDYELVITATDTNKAITFSDSNAVKQLDTVTIANPTAALDTFTWSDGTNSITLDETLGTLVAGETQVQTGARIAAAINADPTLGELYTATDNLDGTFSIEAKTAGTSFTGTSTGLGSTELTTTPADTDSLTTTLGLNNIQVANAATFKYNGVEITRDTNEIDDLATGMTIKLNNNQTAGETASIKVEQNSTAISSEMSLFVNGYNSLMTNLQDMTRSDRESGAVGIFNGESFVKSIKRDLASFVTRVDTNGNSLIDYGIDIDRYGEMSLDVDAFAKKFVEDPEGMELIFSGDNDTDGIFTNLNNKMTEYTGYNKLLSNFSDQLDDKKDALVSRHEQQVKFLDDRYAIMTKRFTAYDAIISRINSQFSSLQMMIDAEANKN